MECKKPVQAIELDASLIDPAMTGNKKMTIRLGVRDVLLSRAILFSAQSNWCKDVQVQSVEFIRLCDVSDSDARADGFEDSEDLFRGMKKYYPQIESHDLVTIIRWS